MLSKMATELTQQTKIILTRLEDWEKWYRQLRDHVNREIWSLLDFKMNEKNEEELIEQSQKPRFCDYNHNATTFTNLFQAQQKIYESAQQFYTHDLREYNHQQDLLREARTYIQSIISTVKQTHLDSELSKHKWILTLRNDTAPPKEFMLNKAREQYINLLRSFKTNKIHPWLDEWEAVMLDCIKYDLSEIQRDLWLKNLIKLFKLILKFCYEQFRKNATDENKSDFTEFCTVARELCEKFE